MPAPATLKINEIFWSFQGEGLHLGSAAVFIRLSGCSTGCSFCDSKASWTEFTPMTARTIIEHITPWQQQYHTRRVIISGGEPLEQDLSELCQQLLSFGFSIAIETNGVHFQDLPIHWWTVSPKPAHNYHIHPQLLSRISELKLVAIPYLTLDIIQTLRSQIPSSVPIFLQPNGQDSSSFGFTFSLFKECQEKGLESVKAGVQLHKLYGVS
jgi:organic radical activating enzyme